MNVLKEFKEFAIKGSVIDMGIGVIIGTAFGKMVDSFIADIIMPPIGLLLGKVDFSNLYVNLSNEKFQSLLDAKEAGAATVNYGLFVNSILHFGIVAFASFMIIRQINRIRNIPSSNLSKQCPYCCTTIPEEAKRCPNCTTQLDEPLADQSNQEPQMKIKIS